MEHEAEELMADMLSKNIVNHESYPGTTNIQNRCVNMIARLFNAPTQEGSVDAVGTSTVGSSEAIMLATLAMKKRWANKRRAAGKDCSKPNLVMSSAVQVCWKKAARYFDIEEKYVYCTKDRYTIDPNEAVGLVDENTIGICSIMGTTYTGEYEDTKAINDLLVRRHLDLPIHIDAASGGFVAPFVNPDLIWDFRLEKVVSINVSGHKYGLVYAGIGWVIWRGAEYLPKGELCSLSYFLISNLTVLSCRTYSQHELSRRRAAHLHPKLLSRRLARHQPILQTHQPRQEGLPPGHARSDPHGRLPRLELGGDGLFRRALQETWSRPSAGRFPPRSCQGVRV